MNQKAELFEKFLVEEEITCFEKREIPDEDHTMVYRSYLQTPVGDMPIFVLLDDTIYNTVRVVVGQGVVNGDNYQSLLEFMNTQNNTYKNFKYYIEDADATIYLDCINQSTVTNFDPRLIYVLMTQIVEYMPGAVEGLVTAAKISTLPDPHESH